MKAIKITYDHNLRTNFENNGNLVVLDGPKQFGGLEEYLSPTDLLAAALASCTLTLLGLQAEKLGIDVKGTTSTVTEKEMTTTHPRRIAKITVEISSPANPSAEEQKKLEDAALHCAVHLSLHPSITQNITFRWNAK